MNEVPQIYLIGGVSGVGKSSLLVHLKRLLPADRFDIRDFDERGVPDGGGLAWHDKESLHWLNVAAENAKQNKSTIICGFVHPVRIRDIHQKEEHPPAKLFLLHASGDTIRKRLLGRYPTKESIKEINRAAGTPLEDFIINNVTFAPTLRSLFEEAGHPIIDTDTKTPEEIAKEIVNQL